ncbi:MAG: hypothetical protein R2724_16455, partial [Bryobacterales bacterium]
MAFAVSLAASPIVTTRSLDALAEADALIVGRLLRVEKGIEVFPPPGRQWPHPVFEHVALIE